MILVSSDPDCTACKLHQTADKVCQMGFSSHRQPSVMVISRMNNSKSFQEQLERELTDAGVDVDDCYFTSVVKCRTFKQDPGRVDLKTCTALHLDREIAELKPQFVLALGNEALQAVTGHSGIMKWRGKVEEVTKGSHTFMAVASISPASINRNPGQAAGFRADLSLFNSVIRGDALDRKIPTINVIDTKEKLAKLRKKLRSVQVISYDIETAGQDEYDPEGGIVSLAGTCVMKDTGKVFIFALPLDHPGSVFRRVWQRVLAILAPELEAIPKQVAHNGKYDAKWMRHFGVHSRVTFDTMLAAHLLDENRRKGLKELGRTELGVAPWGIDTRDLRNTPIDEVLTYNALDTYYTYRLYLIFRQQLADQPHLFRIFTKLTMPANEKLIEAERRGVWIDRDKLATAYKVAFDMRAHIDEQLMEWVPDPSVTEDSNECPVPWPKKGRTQKYVDINFNTSNFLRWWLFDWLGMPVLDRGKAKDDGSDGAPSVAEAVMIALRDLPDHHPVVDLLMERSKWQKYCSTYVSRYMEIVDANDRIHTTFKLAGTVTGRLSSGKEDEEKITAKRDRGRGVNLQQVPRDPFIRGLFGASPGYSFVEADLAQIEFRLAAFAARERTALHLIRTGVDVHLAMAAKMTGKPQHLVTKEERKAAKPVNFGYLYGMWWTKFMITAKLSYGIDFTEEAARQSRIDFFDMYPDFERWHRRQRQLVRKYGRVISPIGRVRRLPDVFSADEAVQKEAERQAINSPIQAMASDMNILAMILIDDEFRAKGIDGHVLGTVHDAINFEIRNEHLAEALPIIKFHMENLPLEEYFGCILDVPIATDLKVGSHWGDAKELDNEQVLNFSKYHDQFVVER